jgi:hypothetical protein
MSATALLDRLGRPGDIRLGTARPATIPRLPTGLPPLDTVLDGGLPRGRLTELAGARSTGRTALACAIAGSATRAGETIAWVDPEDGLEPETAADAGVLLAHVLWVRPRGERDALRAAELLLGAGGFGLVVLDLGSMEATRRGAPWPRLAHAAERTGAVLLVAAAQRLAGTCAALGLELQSRRVHWNGGPGRLALLERIDARVTIVRSRIGQSGQALVVRQVCA